MIYRSTMQKLKTILKLALLCACLTCIIFSFNTTDNPTAYADDSGSDLTQQLGGDISNQLGNLNFLGLDDIIKNLASSEQGIFGGTSFLSKVQSLINGSMDGNYNSFFSYILNFVFDDILNFVPILATIIAIAIVCSFVGQIANKNKSIANIIYFVCFGAVVIIVFLSCKDLLSMVQGVLGSIKTQMEIIFPILLTLITSLGGLVTVSAFQPAIAFLSVGIMDIFTALIIPLFIFTLVFNVVGNLSNNVRLDKFAGFTNSLFKWIIGIIFTIFIAFITIQGITASSVDGISIKTAKFALKSYIPILGGYLSDGLNLIMASSVLIKNAVGAAGLLLLAATVLLPVLKIVIFMFGLKLVAAVIEPLSDSRMSNFISGVAKCMTMLIVCILGVGFMYLITVGLLMCIANGV